MNLDDLENRICTLPERPVPAGWRREILHAAEAHAGRERWIAVWPEWLTLNRASTGALAAAWTTIIALHLSTGTEEARSPVAAGETAAFLKRIEMQQHMLAEMPGSAPPPVRPPLGNLHPTQIRRDV